MPLNAPSTLSELLIDGAAASAEGRADLERRFGAVTSFAATGPSAADPALDAPVDLRINDAPATGVRLAEIAEGTLTWRTARINASPLPELHTPQPLSDALIAAAGTIMAGAPVVLSPRRDGSAMLVAITGDFLRRGAYPRQALIAGLAQYPQVRTVLGYAALRGFEVTEQPDAVVVHTTPRITVTLDASGTPEQVLTETPYPTVRLADMAADAAYLSAEHQLFYEGVFPGVRPSLDLGTNQARLGGIRASATVVATITRQTWTWGWADESLPPAARQASAGLRRCGYDTGIVVLARPQLPLELAQRWDLPATIKPVLGVWTHAALPLSPEVTAIVALSAPQLRLPQPTTAAAEATLAAELPAGADPTRAWHAYEQARRISW
ncbi:DUF6882 domain-containing protein [Corynebacterium uberis]|uniref:DUF6882 domain-containing protein n=1 Tax=Corynebacterium TaxID=1716 RepID=UPI001D0AEAD3|nr:MULTISPECIES: DUF6882 domain-containing protein [Corynebacterium]MCZ9308811.1 hypothetical protein [Corynebacterium sp. c6VSa_13]UDL72661.1 hypothetical protein LH391_05875 [Corynebacterium uberis]UDL76463.1 hypothetical protein LH393_03530 [Corynebacterium uberis]UDL78675.1 hypothetical protein LH394_03515 [Corynebacterium uberis]UDL80954.1 hypothetical protein LH392_03940 [Corynebacterium uberis]